VESKSKEIAWTKHSVNDCNKIHNRKEKLIMKKYITWLLLISIGIILGLLIGNNKWDYQTKEQYCYKCGATQVLEIEKTIFNLCIVQKYLIFFQSAHRFFNLISGFKVNS
jgi:hypothetical protein